MINSDTVYNAICSKKEMGHKQVALLVDPDKFNSANVEKAIEAGVDYFFVGGSLLTDGNLDKVIESIKKISEIPFILYNKGSATREYIDKVFIKKDIKPNILVESTSPTFMKELAIGGYGVTLLPKNFIQRELDNKKLFVKKFPFKFKREIGLYLSRDSRIKEADEIVKEIIKNLE